MNFIKLDFSGVLQHYSPYNYVVTAPSSTYYRTERYPTKKAVVGIVSASLGYPRNDNRIVELFDKLDCRYKVVKSGTVITDFQTVRPLKGYKFVKFNGDTSDEAILKTVEYLQDYKFNVYIGADDETLETIYKALINPVYHQYFGKRSCVPMTPIATSFELLTNDVIEGDANVYVCV